MDKLPVYIPPPVTSKEQKITVAGVSFDASQVKSAVVEIEGREVHIQAEKEAKPNKIGFN